MNLVNCHSIQRKTPILQLSPRPAVVSEARSKKELSAFSRRRSVFLYQSETGLAKSRLMAGLLVFPIP